MPIQSCRQPSVDQHAVNGVLLVLFGAILLTPVSPVIASDFSQLGAYSRSGGSYASASVKLVTDPATGQSSYVVNEANSSVLQTTPGEKVLPTNTSFAPGGFNVGDYFGGSGAGSIMNGESFGGFDMNNIFGSIFGRYRNMLSDLYEKYRNQIMDMALGSIISENVLGDLGILDPQASADEMAEKIWGSLGQRGEQAATQDMKTQRIDRFNYNPAALAQSLNHESNRLTSRTMANSVLGQEGQQAMLNEMQAAEQSMEMIHSKAEEAQGLDVTQDVMKAMTEMLAGSSQLQSGSYAQLMLMRQQMAASNQVLSDTSEALDERNRAEKAQMMGTAAGAARSAASLYLPGMR